MTLLKVQLNHPGKEKPFKVGNGYQKVNDLIIREWNDEPRHYRKFLENEGEYITSFNIKPQNGNLLFWGEWEGNSVFTPINSGKGIPNGIHKAFHSTLIRGCENTDPYIFGDCFKYATCSQTGELTNLIPDSLILFGTTKDIGFELDTVFVVKAFESAQSVFSNKGKNYSRVYYEETLEQLGETYLGPNPSKVKRLYQGQTWWGNKDYFSFVPCKVDKAEAFQKAILPIPPMAKQKVGHPHQHLNKLDHIALWHFIVYEVLKQGFCLGIRFSEPIRNDKILSGFVQKQITKKASCGSDAQRINARKGCK
jgi:hypothetical protein